MTLDGMDTRIGLTARSYARVALTRCYFHLAWFSGSLSHFYLLLAHL
jgi:hypothetical protein